MSGFLPAAAVSSTTEKIPPEIATAYRDAKARGLPDGWTCSIDKRNRRKWTAPNGRSCDSIPKALAISVDLGLLPPDFKIISGKRKRSVSPKQERKERPVKLKKAPPAGTAAASKKAPAVKSATKSETSASAGAAASSSSSKSNDISDDDDDEEEERVIINQPPPEPMNPETSLDPSSHRTAAPTTVHWDPEGPDGRKVGWRVKIALSGSSSSNNNNNNWFDGRVVLYDPYTHKHKIEFDNNNGKGKGKGKKKPVWIWLRNEQHNLHLATRMVWAHVKGYAWWPALVIECNSNSQDRREGYVTVEFFGSGETSTLRETPDCIRPFAPDTIDPVVAKHKKKRNASAFQLAQEEYKKIQKIRNDAAVFYATKAVGMAQLGAGKQLVGKRVQLHRSDVNYPYGDTLTAKVRAYSPFQKKWLLSYEISDKTKTKYDASWINVYGKHCSALTVLDKKKVEIQSDDLVPFLVGFDYSQSMLGQEGAVQGRDAELAALLTERCRGCVEYWKTDDLRITCDKCDGEYHLGCFDPPLTLEAWQKMIKEGATVCCSRCTPCRGCYQRDIVFGSHAHPCPPTLSFPKGDSLDLCSMCSEAYSSGRFCPNCAHSWDSDKLDKVTRQIEHESAMNKKRKSGKDPAGTICDSALPLVFGSFGGDEVLPLGANVDPAFFHPETSEWGYGENEMLVCDNCDIWTHAGCAGLDEEEYDTTSKGRHPIYSKEFLCRVCCRQRCKDIIAALQELDKSKLFAVPVTEKVAPNYHDVIRNPVDLQTMLEKADSEEYLNYTWVRDLFELMVLNALTFNKFYTSVWNEAKRYYHDCLEKVFAKLGKAAPPGKYHNDIENNFKRAEEAKKMEQDRVQVDDSVEKKDLVAGSLAASITLPKLRETPPDQASCLPYTEVGLKPVDAFYCSWMDCCYICGSSGAMDTMIFCVDCGESFHTFCVNAPVHSMDEFAVAGWRCPNCKICEISGDVPQDETRMLFCEMCDRAFSLDLLDPPLKSAPPGLWICGQCVDCRSCDNTSEKGGASLKHWSRDPEKCYRCGGCDGLVDDYVASMKCVLCSKLLRVDDADFVQCSGCNSSVHAACDGRAKEHMRELHRQLLTEEEPQSSQYQCPSCSPFLEEDDSDGLIDRKWLKDQSWRMIIGGDLDPHDNYSNVELFSKLVDEVDWKTRDLWREEYKAVVQEGLRLFSRAQLSYNDPRIVIQHALSGVYGLPKWMIQRALRFVLVSRRSKWDSEDLSSDRIDVIVLSAKLAAAFIKVACVVMNVEVESGVACRKRIVSLLQASDECGVMCLPVDPIRNSKSIQEVPGLDDNDSSPALPATSESKPTAPAPAQIAPPLCGWKTTAGVPDRECAWRDSRECCLCHLCGDDDAGFHDESLPSEMVETHPDSIHLGRLLPMSDGFFVHTGCALWSSEVWEDANDGLVHAVEKARSRGAQLKCFGCGRHGATVGCNKSNCLFNYHFPCAKTCGAVFTLSQQVYCSNHKISATGILAQENFEHMKALMIAPEKKATLEKESSEVPETDLCLRVGSLVVHSAGQIESTCDGFHSENYITPPGYVATRIFWSSTHPRKRTVYVLKIGRSDRNGPLFSVLPGDSPSSEISGQSVAQVYNTLMDRVRKANAQFFSNGNLFSKLPAIRRTRKKTFGLNGPQFFGFGLDHVRKRLEASAGVEAVVAPLTGTSPKYRFCFVQPSIELIKDLQRKRAAAKAERALENSSGCARTEGMKAVARSGGSGRITRALVRSVEEDAPDTGGSASMTKKEEQKAKADRHLNQKKYKRMKAVPMEQRLVARRSHIHGWGLFTKLDIPKDNPIVEYMGETIRRPIADKRERAYEISGEGSCYMFRLDLQRIVDATMIGCMARFMNHSCDPNAYAKIIWVDTEGMGQERKIVVFANRDIASGEEITYDYKFPVEDGSLPCTCGASNCIGRLN